MHSQGNDQSDYEAVKENFPQSSSNCSQTRKHAVPMSCGRSRGSWLAEITANQPPTRKIVRRAAMKPKTAAKPSQNPPPLVPQIQTSQNPLINPSIPHPVQRPPPAAEPTAEVPERPRKRQRLDSPPARRFVDPPLPDYIRKLEADYYDAPHPEDAFRLIEISLQEYKNEWLVNNPPGQSSDP